MHICTTHSARTHILGKYTKTCRPQSRTWIMVVISIHTAHCSPFLFFIQISLCWTEYFWETEIKPHSTIYDIVYNIKLHIRLNRWYTVFCGVDVDSLDKLFQADAFHLNAIKIFIQLPVEKPLADFHIASATTTKNAWMYICSLCHLKILLLHFSINKIQWQKLWK